MINFKKSRFRIFASLYLILTMHWSNAETQQVLKLSSGENMPVVGLGTHGLDKEELDKILTSALDLGYRHIDTAFIYKNEETIGTTVEKWLKKGGNRSDIFITSKLPYFANSPSGVEKYLKLSLERLKLEYVDLYLIHTPFGVVNKNGSYDVAENADGTAVLDNDVDYTKVWKEMEKQLKAGKIKSIGLSNFNQTQIWNIMKNSEIKPSNLQVEVHLYHQQQPLLDFCQKQGIVVTGYAPLGSPGARQTFHPEQTEKEYPNPFNLPVVLDIAKKHNKTNVQVLLRHLVQKNIAVTPSSKKVEFLKSNLEIFDFQLTPEEVSQLDGLDKGDKGKIFDYKFLKGIEKHKDYPFTGAV